MTETEDYDKSATPEAHKTSHQDGGSDEISAEGLDGELSAEQKSAWGKVSGKPTTFTPAAHKTNHQDGGSDELSVAGLSGELADEQNAGKIKGVVINDTDKADQKVLGWDEATNRIVYLAMAAAGFASLDVFEATNLISPVITVGISHAIT